ncbi:MAG: 4Fe-4S binding protein [Candidatus Bathyarchaeia archaeon]
MNPKLAGLIIGSFVFYIYFRPYWILGIVFGLGLGTLSFFLLETWRIHRIRRYYVTILAVVTWLGSISLLAEMNLDSFIRYLNSHLSAYELRAFTFEFRHVPFVRQLPNTLGSTILMQLSLPWVELNIPHPVERLLFLIFPFHYPPITFGMLIFVLVPHLALILVLGRAWCGWVCYFGNQTEAIASRGREKWKLSWLRESFKADDGRVFLDRLKQEVRAAKYLFMVALLIPSFFFGLNTICTLGLIFKFQYPLGAALITLMLILTAVILPLATKKRWWCMICPAGAGIAVADAITPFKIEIDPLKCDRCFACVNVCPMHAISPRTLVSQSKPNLDCIKCCRCIEACTRGAIDVKIRGTGMHTRSFFMPLMIAVSASWYVWFAVAIIDLFDILF